MLVAEFADRLARPENSDTGLATLCRSSLARAAVPIIPRDETLPVLLLDAADRAGVALGPVVHALTPGVHLPVALKVPQARQRELVRLREGMARCLYGTAEPGTPDVLPASRWEPPRTLVVETQPLHVARQATDYRAYRTVLLARVQSGRIQDTRVAICPASDVQPVLRALLDSVLVEGQKPGVYCAATNAETKAACDGMAQLASARSLTLNDTDFLWLKYGGPDEAYRHWSQRTWEVQAWLRRRSRLTGLLAGARVATEAALDLPSPEITNLFLAQHSFLVRHGNREPTWKRQLFQPLVRALLWPVHSRTRRALA